MLAFFARCIFIIVGGIESQDGGHTCSRILRKVVSGTLPFRHFKGSTLKSSRNKTFSPDSDIYFVSLSNTVLAIRTSSARLSTLQSHPRVNRSSRM